MTDLPVSEDELRELLVEELELLAAPLFDASCQASRRLKISVLRAITERARIPLGFVLSQLAQKWGVGFTDLKVNGVHTEALRSIKEDFARAHLLVGFDIAGAQLSVAMADPRDRKTIGDLQRLSGSGRAPRPRTVRCEYRMRRDAVAKALIGETTVDEILRGTV